MLKLSEIVPVVRRSKRIGRGGGRGGTSGRGSKGQRARSGGGVRKTFEGGQTPIVRRLPKRGFSNVQFECTYEVVNIGALERVFDQGSEITRESLIAKGMIRGARGKLVKILGGGALQKQFVVHADACSGAAMQAIERQNGKVHVTVKEK